ncbi:MAG TPA: sensor histidine kinase [Puia sp.]|nr:sensor histidine kinase [Puia sp.]
MGKRLFLLLGTFVAFYYVIRIVYDLPNWVHGYPQFIWWPRSLSVWLFRLGDIAFYFLIVLIPYRVLFRWYPPKKLLLSLGLITTGLLALFLLRYWVEYTRLPRGLRLKTYFENTIVYVLIFAVYGAVFYFIRYSYYKELQQKDLEIQNRQSELSFLRSQINPHFLFNNLNNIYSLVYHGSGQALTAIAGLSELLRYMLYDTTEKVPLQKELDYIQKYIALQRLRFDHPIQVRTQVEGAAAETAIPPLLLIPFIENAFKHGDFSGSGHGLVITVITGAQKTWFHCSNRIAIRQKDSQGGIGLENVKRRLSLLYPGRHSLLIKEDTLQFSVNLELIHE